jgi:hypothetical protein
MYLFKMVLVKHISNSNRRKDSGRKEREMEQECQHVAVGA